MITAVRVHITEGIEFVLYRKSSDQRMYMACIFNLSDQDCNMQTSFQKW